MKLEWCELGRYNPSNGGPTTYDLMIALDKRAWSVRLERGMPKAAVVTALRDFATIIENEVMG